jgi:hypothetical protein
VRFAGCAPGADGSAKYPTVRIMPARISHTYASATEEGGGQKLC